VRRVALAVAIIIAWLPGLSQALGLGEIDIDSYLNQPLSARINLLTRSGEDLFDMRVQLASRKSFERAGIDFQQVLRGLRFSVETDAKGKTYIKVTTHKRMRDPFINFLVEVNWSRGRIQREYTLLIDPPTFTRATPQPTRAPVAARPARQSRPAIAPARTSGRRSAAETSFPAQPYSGETYTTTRRDTLWQIANDVRPSADISTEQMMLALLDENPNAFIGQNINRLKAGQTLNIPGYDSITSMSQREARAEVGRQYRDWKQGRIGRTGTADASSGDSGRLELLASDTAGVSAGGQTGAAGDQVSQQDLALSREATEASRQENEELRSRISTLEQQIDNVTRIASLKDEQLAALQKTLSDLRAQEGIDSEQPVTDMPVPSDSEEGSIEETTEAATERPDYGPQIEATPAAPDAPVNQHAVEGYQPVDTDSLPPSEMPEQPFRNVDGTVPAEELAESAGGDDLVLTSYTDEMMAYIDDQPLVASIVAAVLAFIVIVVLMSVVRRRRENEDFQESILSDSGEMSLPLSDSAVDLEETLSVEDTETDDDLTNLDVSSVSQISGFDISELDSVDAETAAAEADPLTEADVLMAYGRFQPAEVMIGEAISLEPERKDLRMKLLEIFHAGRNKAEFEKEAGKFHLMLGGAADPVWDKVKEMGVELCPDSQLFGDDAETGSQLDGLEATQLDMSPLPDIAAEDNQKTDSGLRGDELDFDLTSFEKEGAGDNDETVVSSDIDDMELDMDLGTGGAADDDVTEDRMASDLATELEGIADSMVTGEIDLDTMGAGDDASAEFELGGSLEPTVEVHSSDIFDAGVSELDEITTKLDLAKAYIDMGDPDGARSILDEVMEEGNDDQKNDAQGLLDQI